MDDKSTIGIIIAKLGSVWVAVGISNWSDAAAFAAFVYTMALLGDWTWKKWKAWREAK